MIGLASLAAAGSTSATTIATAVHSSKGSILDPIAKPIAWVLAEIYSVVPNYGVAILALSVLWMAIISPLTLKSTRSMLAMQKLQPQMKRLQEQHKDDRQAFAQAQMDLFREHQVSPFGSCLPMLLPMPVFFALFRVITGLSHTVKGAAANCVGQVGGNVSVACPKYLSHSSQMWKDIHAAHGHLTAFGMNLANNAFSPHSSFWAALPFWILLLVMGGTSYVQTAQMMSRNPAAAQNNPQMRVMKYLPLIFVLFCLKFPAGVVLYYAMSNICRIVQQDAMYRYDPKVKALVAQEVEEVEALTHEIDERDGKKGPSGGGGSGRSKPVQRAAQDAPQERPQRGRFRDLLAAAAEEQRKSRETKGSTQQAKPASGSNGNADRSGSGNGQRAPAARNGKPGGQGAARGGAAGGGSRSGQRSGGHKTNRKRRGR
jgi:YidC/Oxa1 family membrane protein insertase